MEWWAYKIWDQSVLFIQKCLSVIASIFAVVAAVGLGYYILWAIAQHSMQG